MLYKFKEKEKPPMVPESYNQNLVLEAVFRVCCAFPIHMILHIFCFYVLAECINIHIFHFLYKLAIFRAFEQS